MHILLTYTKFLIFPIAVNFVTKGEITSLLGSILTPAVVLAILDLIRYCIKCFVQYQELKLLVASGKERVTVTKNDVSYESQNQ
mgnify:FL=1|nr:MAG TPA: hypothetical protein [Caudoviricetes sp.]